MGCKFNVRVLSFSTLLLLFCVFSLTGCDTALLGIFNPAGGDVDPAAGDNPAINTEPAAVVNIQLDAEKDDTAGIARLIDELVTRGIGATVYVTSNYSADYRREVQDFHRQGFEVALHGQTYGEDLTAMTLAEQRKTLERALDIVDGCQPCGTLVEIAGFRPQGYLQNDDTYQIIDELGLVYNSGFHAGRMFLEDHEGDRGPYSLTSHSFDAVPISTVEISGQLLPLCDTCFGVTSEMTGEQWGDALDQALTSAIADKQPLVVIFHGWYTGDDEEYDYFQPFLDFLDAVEEQEISFVTTKELVEMKGKWSEAE